MISAIRLPARSGDAPVASRIAAVAAFVACCTAGAVHAAAGDVPAPPFIEVTGQAELQAPPDRALLDFGVVTRADTAQASVQQNAERMQGVLTAVRKVLGAKAQIGTGTFTLRPQYAHDREGKEPPRLTGYMASNVVRVQTAELARVGELIDIATRAGANQVEQVRFVLSDVAELRRRALREAVKDARTQAEAIAATLPAKLGAVESVVEQDGGPVRPFQEGVALRAEVASTTPIEPGVVTLQARVRAKWRMEEGAR